MNDKEIRKVIETIAESLEDKDLSMVLVVTSPEAEEVQAVVMKPFGFKENSRFAPVAFIVSLQEYLTREDVNMLEMVAARLMRKELTERRPELKEKLEAELKKAFPDDSGALTAEEITELINSRPTQQ